MSQKFDYCHRDAEGTIRCREETGDATRKRPLTISLHLYWSNEEETVYQMATAGGLTHKVTPRLTYVQQRGRTPMCTITQWNGLPKSGAREIEAGAFSDWSPCTSKQIRAVQKFEERLAATVRTQDRT